MKKVVTSKAVSKKIAVKKIVAKKVTTKKTVVKKVIPKKTVSKKTIIGSFLWYSGYITHSDYVKSENIITDDNVKVGFSDGPDDDVFYTVSFTKKEIENLRLGKTVENKNDMKSYQLYSAWKESRISLKKIK